MPSLKLKEATFKVKQNDNKQTRHKSRAINNVQEKETDREKKKAELVSKVTLPGPIGKHRAAAVASALRAHFVLAKWHSGFPLMNRLQEKTAAGQRELWLQAFSFSCFTWLSYFGL